LLNGEPQNAGLVEGKRVRITRLGVGQGVFGNGARTRIEPVDKLCIVAGKPDIPMPVFYQAMRPRVRGLQRIFFELTYLR
jgi:hypothetical protein